MSHDTSTVTSEWSDLCALSDVPEQGGKYVVHGGRGLGVFRLDGEIRVLDDNCPHAGGSLSAGWIEQGCAVCPWHAWAFDLKSGECPDNPFIAVEAYPARVVAGRVQVRFPSPK